MRLRYDLHIHSALSPCADDDMTPANIAQMAALCGLGMIALTDHNSCKNTPAFLAAAARAGVVAVPGMELWCAEECHVVCLFAELDAALAFDRRVEAALPPIPNDTAAFGRQLLIHTGDAAADETAAEECIAGEYPQLLNVAADISVDDAAALAREYGGVAFPAHIDRPNLSILSALGAFPPIGFTAAEVTEKGDVAALLGAHAALRGMPLLMNSDAHSLEALVREFPPDGGPWLDLPENTPAALIAALRGEAPCRWGR